MGVIIIHRDKPLTLGYNDDLRAAKLKHPDYVITLTEDWITKDLDNPNHQPKADTYKNLILKFSPDQLAKLTGFNYKKNPYDEIEKVKVESKMDNKFIVNINHGEHVATITKDQIHKSLLNNQQTLLSKNNQQSINQEKSFSQNIQKDNNKKEDKSHLINNGITNKQNKSEKSPGHQQKM